MPIKSTQHPYGQNPTKRGTKIVVIVLYVLSCLQGKEEACSLEGALQAEGLQARGGLQAESLQT